MTDIQPQPTKSTALLIAASARAFALTSAMNAENKVRESFDEAMAYRDSNFFEVVDELQKAIDLYGVQPCPTPKRNCANS